jgi:hypothetical protein
MSNIKLHFVSSFGSTFDSQFLYGIQASLSAAELIFANRASSSKLVMILSG